MTGFFADPRRRILTILAAAAVLALALAALALMWRAARIAPKYPSHPVIAGFGERLHGVTSIRIESQKNGTVDVAFLPMRGWVLPGNDNFPAAFEVVRRTLNALAAMQSVEPATATPEWFRYLGLDAPPKGAGTRITVRDGKDNVLAALIVGKTADIGDQSGGVGLYVRREGENQGWLAQVPAPLPTSISDWMDKDVIAVDRARIASVEFRPSAGPSFTLMRGANNADFRFKTLPRGRTPVAPYALNLAGAALANFSFEGARPRAELDFAGGAHVIARTFDGLIVAVDVIKDNGEYWARIYANAVPGNAEAGKTARTINARAYGWAYRLPAELGAAFSSTLESLLSPQNG